MAGRRPGMNRGVAAGLRVVASLALLVLAWRLAGGEALLASLHGVDPAWLGAAVALSVPMQVLSAARWRYTCARLGLALGWRRAVGDYYLATLANMVLPGGVAGDLARVFRHGRAQDAGVPGRYRRAAHAVLLERGAGQAALMLVLLAGALAQLDRFAWLGAWLAAAGAALVAGLAALALAARRRGSGSSGSAVVRLLDDARQAFLPATPALVQGLLSLAVVGCYVAAYWCATRAVHAPLDPLLALLAVPLVLSAMALPLSVGGLGLREASAAALWPLLGLDAGAGAAAALCYGATMLLGSLPGAAVLLARPRRAAAAA